MDAATAGMIGVIVIVIGFGLSCLAIYFLLKNKNIDATKETSIFKFSKKQ